MAERTDELTREGDEDAVNVDEPDSGVESDAFGVDGAGLDDASLDAGAADENGSFDVGDRTTRHETTTAAGTSRVGRVKQRAGSVFSPTTFLLQFVATLVGAFVLGNLVPLVPAAVAAFPGILLMAAVMGTLSSRPRYVEAAVAGGASGALVLFFGAVTLSVVTGGTVPVVGAVAGALSAVVGFYAGRDLRDGVTKDL